MSVHVLLIDEGWSYGWLAWPAECPLPIIGDRLWVQDPAGVTRPAARSVSERLWLIETDGVGDGDVQLCLGLERVARDARGPALTCVVDDWSAENPHAFEDNEADAPEARQPGGRRGE